MQEKFFSEISFVKRAENNLTDYLTVYKISLYNVYEEKYFLCWEIWCSLENAEDDFKSPRSDFIKGFE